MDKSKIIEKIVTAPQSLTEEEILTICADDQLRDLYDGAVLMSSALIEVPDFDTESSYAQLQAKIVSNDRLHRFTIIPFGHSVGRKAAVTIGILLTAMAVIAAIYMMPNRDEVSVNPIIESTNTTGVQTQQPTTLPESKIAYDDVPLSQILEDISARYGCKVKYINEGVRDSRFHITIPAQATLRQVVDMLNVFDEVKITIEGDTIIVE